MLNLLRTCRRTFQSTSLRFDALSTFNVLQGTPTVDGLTSNGFVLDNGTATTTNGVMVIQDKLFLWDHAMEPSAFYVFEVVKPRPDIVVVGTGKTMTRKPEVVKYLASLGIQTEVLDTRNALATFSVLQQEERRVAAALMPPNVEN